MPEQPGYFFGLTGLVVRLAFRCSEGLAALLLLTAGIVVCFFVGAALKKPLSFLDVVILLSPYGYC